MYLRQLYSKLSGITRLCLEREIWGSSLGPVKWDTVLPTARDRCNISLKEAVLPGAMMRK